jgi:hypothetical protein
VLFFLLFSSSLHCVVLDQGSLERLEKGSIIASSDPENPDVSISDEPAKTPF